MWKTEKIQLNDNVYVWILDKKDRAKARPIVIETKNGETVLINYPSDTYSIDIDRKDK